MKYFDIGRLRFKLILLILIILLPMFAFSFYNGLHAMHNVRADAFRAAQDGVNEISDKHDEIINQTRALFMFLSRLAPIRQLDREASKRILADLQSENSKLYSVISIVLPNGNLNVTSLSTMLDTNYSDRSWFQSILKNRSFTVGEYVIGRLAGKAVLPAAGPILDEAGNIKAILLAAINLDVFDISPLKKNKLQEGSVITVFDHKGVVLIRHPAGGLVGKAMPEAEIVRKALSQQEGTIEARGVDGKEKLFAFRVLGMAEGKVCASVGIPVEAAFADVRHMMFVHFSILGIISLLILSGAFWLGNRYIENPIKKLLMATRCLAEGAVDAKTGFVKHEGEIGELALAFDLMTDSLREREAALKKALADNNYLIANLEGMVEDRTKQMDAAMLRAEATKRDKEDIIDTIREPLLVLDSDLRVISASRSFYEFFKVSPKETSGQLIYDLGNKQWNIPKLRELLETILPEKATFNDYEVEHDFTTIGRRIMLLNARQIQRELGKEQIVLLAIEDITERKKIEVGLKKSHEELKALATELIHTAQVKSEFLANMSHELRTPLNAVIGFSEVLEDGPYGDLNDRQKTYVQHIFNAGTHLLSLINDILDLSKVEAGKMKLEVSRFPIRAVLDSSVVMLNKKAMNHGIALSIEVEPDADIHVEADERKIKQILFNLLSNAVKFTPDSGRVTVRARMTVVDNMGEQRRMIEVSIEDTGIGIKEEDLPKLFSTFTQLHQSVYTKEYGGTGLGLALTKHLVELHHGSMWVKSEFGKGSRFYFSLPV